MNIKKAEDLCYMLDRTMHTPIHGIADGKKIHIVSFNQTPEGISFITEDNHSIDYKDVICYDPMYDGAITSIRIYLKDGYQPMAELAFAFGGTFTFEWDRCDFREMFMSGINAYTLMYDTRCNRPFTDWVKSKEEDR